MKYHDPTKEYVHTQLETCDRDELEDEFGVHFDFVTEDKVEDVRNCLESLGYQVRFQDFLPTCWEEEQYSHCKVPVVSTHPDFYEEY